MSTQTMRNAHSRYTFSLPGKAARRPLQPRDPPMVGAPYDGIAAPYDGIAAPYDGIAAPYDGTPYPPTPPNLDKRRGRHKNA